MKRVIIISMCIILITTSIVINIPMGIYAASNDFTLSTATGCQVSYTEARNAVNNKGDIYNSQHQLLFSYTPTSDSKYNWLYVADNVKCTDAQLLALLQSNNIAEVGINLIKASASNNGLTRFLLSSMGFLVAGDSSVGTDLLDTITSNYNYLNDMTYSETEGLTIGKDTAEKLKEKARLQYMKSIHAINYVSVSTSPAYAIEKNRSKYDEEADYVSDWQLANSYDYAFSAGVVKT